MDKPAPSPRKGANKSRGGGPWWFVKHRPSMSVSLGIFVVAVGGMIVAGVRPTNAVLIGFDVASLAFLLLLTRLFNQATPATMRTQAKALDFGRWAVLWGGVLLAGVVLAALANELHAAKGGGVLELTLGVASVVLSWLFLNVMFAIHYAHGYYGNLGEEHQGLDFPKTPEPDYWDFAYFSIVIGMTFQVSDVEITSNYLRRVALMHSVIAFFFNVFIIAITVNIVAGQTS